MTWQKVIVVQRKIKHFGGRCIVLRSLDLKMQENTQERREMGAYRLWVWYYMHPFALDGEDEEALC